MARTHCTPEYNKAYYQANKERIKVKQRQYYEEHKEARQKYQLEYYHKNRERLIAYQRTIQPGVKHWCSQCGRRRVTKYETAQLCDSCYRMNLAEEVKASTTVVNGVEVAVEYVPPKGVAAVAIMGLTPEQIDRMYRNKQIVTTNRRVR